MSRGRRTPSPALPAGSTEALGSLAPALVEARARIAEVTTDTDQVIAKTIARLLEGKEAIEQAPTMPEAAGGIAGDRTRSARDLVALAVWASAIGDEGRVAELLERAHAHQKAHGQWIADQRRTAGSLDGQQLAGEQLVAADWLAGYIEPMLNEPWRLARAGERPHVRVGFGELTRIALALEQSLAELARAGEADLVRQVAAEAWTAIGLTDRAEEAANASDACLERLGRVAAALEHLDDNAQAMRLNHGSGIPPLLHLVGRLDEDQLRLWGDGRDDPEEWEAAGLRTSGGRLFYPGLTRTATTSEDAMVLARARLRRVRIRRAGDPDLGTEGVGVRVPVTAAVLADLAAAHRAKVDLVEERDAARSSTLQLGGVVRLAAATADGPVEVSFIAGAGQSRSLNAAKRRDAALAGLSEAGVQPDLVSDAPLSDAPPQHGPAHPRDDDPRQSNWWSLLGPERCEHPAKSHPWRRQGNVNRLSCEACGRENVVSVPLHRLERETIMNEERYLAEERFQAALRADTRPIESLAQLRVRDGQAPREACDYAVGPGAAAAPKARASSLAGAFGARR